jgi:hypothetical protein
MLYRPFSAFQIIFCFFGHLLFVFVYLEDLLVQLKEEHLNYLQQIFEMLTSNELVINLKMCILNHVQPRGSQPHHLCLWQGSRCLPTSSPPRTFNNQVM